MKPKGINRGAVADSVIKVIRVPSFSTTRRVIFLRLSITALHSLLASSLRSLDSERRKRQHLINQVQWYGRRESKHLCSAYNDRNRVQQPMYGERYYALLLLIKPPQRRPKRYSFENSSSTATITTNHGAAVISATKEKPRRYLRGNALWDCWSVRIETEAQRLCRQSPTAVPERPNQILMYATGF